MSVREKILIVYKGYADECKGKDTDSVYNDKENSVNCIANNMQTSSSSSLGACMPHACTDVNSFSTPCHQSYHSSSSHTPAQHTLFNNTSYTTSSSSVYPASFATDAYPAPISTYTPYSYTSYNNSSAPALNYTTGTTIPPTDTYSSSYSNTSNNDNNTIINNTIALPYTHPPIHAPAPILSPTTSPTLPITTATTTLTEAPTPPMIPPSYSSTSLDYPCHFLYQPLCTCLTTTSTARTATHTTTTPTTPTANRKPTKLSRVRKPGPNQGRLFWSCADAGTRKPTKCNYFLWADKLFPTCKCTIQSNTTNHHNNNTTNNGNICIIRRVLKPGPTNGCYFFTCSNYKGCGYFIWAHVYNQTCVPITGAAGVQLLSQYDIPL